MKQLKISQAITNRDSDSLERYLNEIGKISLLDVEDEVSLTAKIRAGDEVALQKLITCNLRFVVSVAKKYQEKGMKLADLISEGNIGLIKAAQRFDDTRGFKFISYAVWWIRQSILLALAEQKRLVRLPGNQIIGISKISKSIVKLEQELERMPELEELAADTEISEDKIRAYLRSAFHPYSLNCAVNEQSDLTLLDTVADHSIPDSDHLTLKASLSADLNRALSILPKREQQIIMMFYGINGYPKTSLEDMQEILNLGRERIRQLKDKAHKTLMSNCQPVLADYFYVS